MRLGHDGSPSSFASIGPKLAVSCGSVVRYTRRCVIALCAIKSRFIPWPSEQEKDRIRGNFLRKTAFDTIGTIDGTMIELWRAPELDRDSWSTRKHTFAMGVTAVTDDKGIFTFFFFFFSTAYLARTHDAAAYRNSDLDRHEHEFFTGDDYLLADATYAVSPRIIPRFKGRNPTAQQVRFNKLHAKARAKVEHGFGIYAQRKVQVPHTPEM